MTATLESPWPRWSDVFRGFLISLVVLCICCAFWAVLIASAVVLWHYERHGSLVLAAASLILWFFVFGFVALIHDFATAPPIPAELEDLW